MPAMASPVATNIFQIGANRILLTTRTGVGEGTKPKACDLIVARASNVTRKPQFTSTGIENGGLLYSHEQKI